MWSSKNKHKYTSTLPSPSVFFFCDDWTLFIRRGPPRHAPRCSTCLGKFSDSLHGSHGLPRNQSDGRLPTVITILSWSFGAVGELFWRGLVGTTPPPLLGSHGLHASCLPTAIAVLSWSFGAAGELFSAWARGNSSSPPPPSPFYSSGGSGTPSALSISMKVAHGRRSVRVMGHTWQEKFACMPYFEPNTKFSILVICIY